LLETNIPEFQAHTSALAAKDYFQEVSKPQGMRDNVTFFKSGGLETGNAVVF
jgi:hypothetical protein